MNLLLIITSFPLDVKVYFHLQINGNNTSKKGKNFIKPASISPPILAKSPQEVNEISKFFKKITENKRKKLYAQASSFSSNTARKTSNTARETLKIKEVFLKL